MKRHGNLYHKIYDLDNLREAYRSAKKGKSHYNEVKEIDKDPDHYLLKIQESLVNKTYKTGEYKVFEKVEGGKLRVIQSLPFYPDRIVHHAIMNICGEFWRRSLIRDTFQSLPGRGQSDTRKRVQKYINENKPAYYLQLDIKKFYPSVKHWVVEKYAIRKFIKCPDTISLLLEILHSIDGLPIGSFLSQIWGNLVLSPLDWFVKQVLRVKGYFRYCDDLILFSDCKKQLRHYKKIIKQKVKALRLSIKPKHTLHHVEENGLDFCGYLFKHSRTRLRERIKSKFLYAVLHKRIKSLWSYYGWIKPLNNKGLWKHTRGLI